MTYKTTDDGYIFIDHTITITVRVTIYQLWEADINGTTFFFADSRSALYFIQDMIRICNS